MGSVELRRGVVVHLNATERFMDFYARIFLPVSGEVLPASFLFTRLITFSSNRFLVTEICAMKALFSLLFLLSLLLLWILSSFSV